MVEENVFFFGYFFRTSLRFPSGFFIVKKVSHQVGGTNLRPCGAAMSQPSAMADREPFLQMRGDGKAHLTAAWP